MFRILGGFMIFGGCMGLGIWYCFRMKGRIRALGSLGNILGLLAGEVRYGRATLPECCGQAARHLDVPFREAFSAVSRRMEENRGEAFGEVFREEVGKVLQELPLDALDRESFMQFTDQTGFMDGQMQLRAIERSMESLHGTKEKLEEENAQKSKMAVGLGAMGGLLLVLVLW